MATSSSLSRQLGSAISSILSSPVLGTTLKTHPAIRSAFPSLASSLSFASSRAFGAAAAPEPDQQDRSDSNAAASSSSASAPPFSEEELTDPLKANAIARTQKWWSGYHSCQDLASALTTLSPNARAPINRYAVMHLLELIKTPEDLAAALKALRAHRLGLIASGFASKHLRAEQHGAALVRALQELGSSSQIVYVVERLSKLGFEGASGDVVLESLVAELGKRGETMLLFRCMIALDREGCLFTEGAGRIFMAAFAAAGRADLAEVLRGEFGAQGIPL